MDFHRLKLYTGRMVATEVSPASWPVPMRMNPAWGARRVACHAQNPAIGRQGELSGKLIQDSKSDPMDNQSYLATRIVENRRAKVRQGPISFMSQGGPVNGFPDYKRQEEGTAQYRPASARPATAGEVLGFKN